MSSGKLNTTLHTTLLKISENPGGFSASEITGYSPETVRRAAEALVADGQLHRANVSARRVRYFSNEAQAKQYSTAKAASPTNLAAGSLRMKAAFKPEDPPIITARTRITVAPSPPTTVFRTNTYLQF